MPERPDPHARQRPADPPRKPKRVVGVFEDFRQHGEYSIPQPVLFDRHRASTPTTAAVPDRLLIRVRPGTTAAFEPVLVRRLQREAPDWSFEVATLEHLRERKLSDYLMPLSVLAVLAGFLLLMVALGLTGVVWQNVTQRLREFGLRRAAGASGALGAPAGAGRDGRDDDASRCWRAWRWSASCPFLPLPRGALASSPGVVRRARLRSRRPPSIV